MNNNRKYPIGYKPNIYSVSFTLKYYDKKYHNQLIGTNIRLQNEAKKHIKETHVPLAIIVLDDENKFPTNNIKQQSIAVQWKRQGIKADRSKFVIGIRNIKIINKHGRVSYDFDENKD